MKDKMKKLIEIDETVLIKLKVLSAFEGLSVKALMEKAVELFVKTKGILRIKI